MAGSRDSDDGMRTVTLSLGSAVYCVVFVLQEVSLVVAPGRYNSRPYIPPSVQLAQLGAQTHLRNNHCSQGPAVY